jgi:hypothetical protein
MRGPLRRLYWVARPGENRRAFHPLVRSCRGKVYFDITSAGGVAEALRRIGAAHGGDLVEFANCSWAPPGNAVCQP